MEQSPESIVEDLNRLDSIPAVALRAIEVSSRSETSIQEICEIVESDPALTAKVLKAANTAWAGSAGQVQSLQRAMTLLGVDLVRSLALSVVISSVFLKAEHKPAEVVLSGMWLHSLACAIASELLAAETKTVDPRMAFVGGLLHDIGKLLLLRWNPIRYLEILKTAQTSGDPLSQVENGRLGIDHAEIGATLLKAWNLPDSLLSVVRDHHNGTGKLGGNGDVSIPTIVRCANDLCHQERLGESGNWSIELDQEAVARISGIPRTELPKITTGVFQRFDEVSSLFELEGGSLSLYLSAISQANQELANLYEQLFVEHREKERAQKALREKEDQLNQALRLQAVGQLAGGVAHDFNNLLTVIKGHLEFASTSLPPGSAVGENLKEIEVATARASALTNQLLAFGKKQLVQPKPVDLNAQLKSLESMLRRLLGNDNTLEVSVSELPVLVIADPDQIEQIFVNLTLNAKDAMPQAGRFQIKIDLLSGMQVSEKGSTRATHNRYARLRFTDTGTGMDQETQRRIFEPFFTTKEVGKGTGLGLSTVYGVVNQADGFILVDSQVGRGTTFEIYLPQYGGQLEEQSAGQAPHSEKPGILVVEDEDSILRLIERSLTAQGYRVFVAGTALQAERLFHESGEIIDLLLTDIVMPQVEGTELYQRLARKKKDLKVLYMSGHSQSALDNMSEASFIQKPFTPVILRDRIRQALGE